MRRTTPLAPPSTTSRPAARHAAPLATLVAAASLAGCVGGSPTVTTFRDPVTSAQPAQVAQTRSLAAGDALGVQIYVQDVYLAQQRFPTADDFMLIADAPPAAD